LLITYFLNIAGYGLAFALTLVHLPVSLGFGISWASQATSRQAEPRRHPTLAWSLVVLLGLLPASMVGTFWPLRLAFLLSLPAMNRLADRVRAGEQIHEPEWVGLYRVLAARRVQGTDRVAVLINNNPGGGSGFAHLGAKPDDRSLPRPMSNLNLDVRLAGGWSYQDED
jgi:hypothetical protein